MIKTSTAKQKLSFNYLTTIDSLVFIIGHSIVFFLTWAPLNTFNIISDSLGDRAAGDDRVAVTAFAVCHLLAMTSVYKHHLLSKEIQWNL